LPLCFIGVKMNIQIIKLNTSEPNLRGKYRQNSVVFVECDASNGGFVINFPDAKSVKDSMFILKLTSAATGTAIITPYAGQYIDGADTYTLANENDSVGLVSNGSVWKIAFKISS